MATIRERLSSSIDAIDSLIELSRSKQIAYSTYIEGPSGQAIFDKPLGYQLMRNRLEQVLCIYTLEGINPRSIFAEGYAICLQEEHKSALAKEIFDAIAANGLSGPKISTYSPKAYEGVANTFGMLGFEGLHRYAHAARVMTDLETEKKALLLLAGCDPSFFPLRMRELHIEALDSLIGRFDMAELKPKLETALKYFK